MDARKETIVVRSMLELTILLKVLNTTYCLWVDKSRPLSFIPIIRGACIGICIDGETISYDENMVEEKGISVFDFVSRCRKNKEWVKQTIAFEKEKIRFVNSLTLGRIYDISNKKLYFKNVKTAEILYNRLSSLGYDAHRLKNVERYSFFGHYAEIDVLRRKVYVFDQLNTYLLADKINADLLLN